nr:MAG TPA: hypothetical protein [Caudoviricetes sp.]
MNTFGSDLSNILSAREKERATVGVTVDVPVIKADTIKKEKTEPEKENTEPEKESTEPEVKQEESEE